MDAPETNVGILIRKPAPEVFAAFADPAVVSKFWFNRASAPLGPDATVTWTWECPGVQAEVEVLEFEQDRRFVIAWDGGMGRTDVEFSFAAQPDGTTFLEIRESGWAGDDDRVVARALDSTSGFTRVLCAAKAWLEHGVDLAIVADHYPAAASA